jgi:hypothetical protein
MERALYWNDKRSCIRVLQEDKRTNSRTKIAHKRHPSGCLLLTIYFGMFSYETIPHQELALESLRGNGSQETCQWQNYRR